MLIKKVMDYTGFEFPTEDLEATKLRLKLVTLSYYNKILLTCNYTNEGMLDMEHAITHMKKELIDISSIETFLDLVNFFEHSDWCESNLTQFDKVRDLTYYLEELTRRWPKTFLTQIPTI